jgi:hypothetical protein
MPIPGQFERDLAEINQMAASIHCKLGIIRNAGLRTTPGGDIHVDASRQIAKTREQIERCLELYANMVRAVSRGESVHDERLSFE